MPGHEVFQNMPGVDQVSEIVTPEDRRRYGCVMRAIESFFGTQASTEEYDARIRKARAGAMTIARLSEQFQDPNLEDQERRRLLREDFKDIRQYIKELSQHDTPLGRAIKGTRLQHQTLKSHEVNDLVLRGVDLIVGYGLYSQSYKGYIGHMAHLAAVNFGALGPMVLSLSDRHRPLSIPDEECYVVRKQSLSQRIQGLFSLRV